MATKPYHYVFSCDWCNVVLFTAHKAPAPNCPACKKRLYLTGACCIDCPYPAKAYA